MNTNIIIKAVADIQKELEPYSKRETSDGPYIMIWPNKIEVISIRGTCIASGQAIEEIINEWDDLI